MSKNFAFGYEGSKKIITFASLFFYACAYIIRYKLFY